MAKFLFMKRLTVILLIAVVLLTTGYYFWAKSMGSLSDDTSAYRAVPIDAPVFMEFNSIKSAGRRNNVVSGFYNSGILNSFFDQADRIDSVIKNSENIGSRLKNAPFIIVLNPEGKESITPLVIAKTETTRKRNEIETLMSDLFPSPDFGFKTRQYNGEKITDIKSRQPNKSFSFSFVKGLFIASPKALMVEKAIRQLDSWSILNNNLFLEVHKSASQQAPVSVYVNYQYFPGLIRNWINPASFKKVDELGNEVRINHRNAVSGLTDFASWSELDLNVKENELQLNGVTVAPDSLNEYLGIFRRQDPVRFRIDQVLPRNTALFFSLGFSNKKAFFNDLENYFVHSKNYYTRDEKLKKINALANADLKSVFEGLADDGVAMAFSDISTDPEKRNVFFIVTDKGNNQAREAVSGWLAKYAESKRIKLSQLVDKYEIDKETAYNIYEFPYPSLPGIWLGEPFSAVSANYFTYWDNYLIFANNRTALENLLHDLTLKTTLANETGYLHLKDESDSKTNINFYLNINNGFNLYKEYLEESGSKLFKSKEDSLRKFTAVNWQVIHSDNLLFNNILINYSDKVTQVAKTEWQSNIGSVIQFKPQLVNNFKDPSNKEIILQDENNRLHLITSQGRVEWSIGLPGKILGEIRQVDLFMNGKLQFVFNTKNKIYVIDQAGNNVSPFPVELRSPATNGMNVFDYDNNRKYRYFVAGEDKKVYAYDGFGKIVSGWKFGQTDNEVTSPVQYFRVGGKDYIVFKDRSGIYVVDRQGQSRLTVPVTFENSQNPIILNTEGTPKMVVTDTGGNIYYLYFNGEYTMKKTSGFSPAHFFNMCDIDGDGIPDFVFADKNELTVINEKGRKIFSRKLSFDILYSPGVYTFSSNDTRIGVVDQAGNRIYLINPDGTTHEGFPLYGNSDFTIGKLSDKANYLNLIVGSNDGSIYNYRLN